jgi:hypothetical protein
MLHPAIAALLLAALLFTQWIGQTHRIAHAGWPPAQVLASDLSGSSAGSDGGNAAGHSCAMLDAATLADTLHVPPLCAPVMSGARVLALWTAFASWDAPPALPFLSRAPPIS